MSGAGSKFHGEVVPAKHTRRKSEMVTALAEADTDPEFWQTILFRISDGEFISTISNELKVNHSILRNWIRGNKQREQEFSEAERLGKQHRINRVMQKAYDTATADIEAPATRMEQLRAAEILLKQGGEETKAPSTIANIAITFVQADNGRPGERVIDPVP